MRWLFVVRNCEAVTLPLKQIINDEKALQIKVNLMQNVYSKIRPYNQSIPDSVTHPRSLMT